MKRVANKARSAIDGLSNLLVIKLALKYSSSGKDAQGLEATISDIEDFDAFALLIKCILNDDDGIALEAQYDSAVI